MAEKCRASFVNSYGQRVTCERDAHEIEDLPTGLGYLPPEGHDAILATWHRGGDGGHEAVWSDRAQGAIPHADAPAPRLADPGERVTAAVSEALTFAISAAADAEREAIAAWVEVECGAATANRIREGIHRAQG